MRHRLYAHIVWTTKHRAPLIDLRVARFLDRFLRAVARQERALILELGLVDDHIHLLIRHHPLTHIPKLLQRLKGASSNVASRERHSDTLLWARGYAIESVSRLALNTARAYVKIAGGWTDGVPRGVEAQWSLVSRADAEPRL